MKAQSIDEVIEILEQIIQESTVESSPLGYFAVLYQRVTIEVKNKLNTQYFDDDARMERLDVLFANRYLEAYFDFKNNRPISQSWKQAFDQIENGKLIILQHLLLGINAHINLDLGIAAAETSADRPIHELEGDFNRINDVLASLVDEIQENLSTVWPILKWILRRLGRIDNQIIDFSMKLARDGAWTFAQQIAQSDEQHKEQNIQIRDLNIAKLADQILGRKWVDRILFRIIRFSERGSVVQKIESLRGPT